MQTSKIGTNSDSLEVTRYPAIPSRVFGLAAFTVLILWAIMQRSSWVAFVDPASLAIAVLGPMALLIACFGWGGIRTSLTTLFVGSSSQRTTADTVSFFRLAGAFALGCGFLGTLIGFVIMLQAMDDPSMIGPAMACVLLTQLYGVLLAALCLVSATIVSRRGTTTQPSVEFDRLGFQSLAIGGVTAAVGISSILLSFFIIIVSMSGTAS